ncbi:hypothetical protein [Shewanella japonica]|uniref:Uncharacterized protein n=1 Tax=Shewanella japonica TaxID=93973 RepID=A0ABN4YKL8_9GAMM|nr:hypothetical protein [Shewanella japonica]ARD21387.1 hypothetical protein SJ2017_1056 [Shewanella japonica]
MNFKKVLSIIAFVIVTLNLGRMIFADFAQTKREDELKATFEKYFTEDDERIKLVWFSAQGKTISLALELGGLGENPKKLDLIKQNSRAYVKDKVCSSQQLRQFVEEGNYISVDIRNGDATYSNVENIMNITMSANKCV